MRRRCQPITVAGLTINITGLRPAPVERTRQQREDGPVRRREPGAIDLPLQNAHLMAKREDLGVTLVGPARIRGMKGYWTRSGGLPRVLCGRDSRISGMSMRGSTSGRIRSASSSRDTSPTLPRRHAPNRPVRVGSNHHAVEASRHEAAAQEHRNGARS